MFWTIFYGIGTLWLLAGNSLAPNNILTAAWWIVGIIGLIPSFLLLETKEMHKNRHCEEAEWYISNYKKIWFAKNPYNALHDFRHFVNMYYDTVNDYRGRMYKQLCNDIWRNMQRSWDHKSLIDTYLETYRFLSINCPGNEFYEPKYIGVVNDEEKLKVWEPSMKINLG